MKQVRFPIVSDDEIMLTEMPFMDLYDESDFISNIKGRLPGQKLLGMVTNYYRKKSHWFKHQISYLKRRKNPMLNLPVKKQEPI